MTFIIILTACGVVELVGLFLCWVVCRAADKPLPSRDDALRDR